MEFRNSANEIVAYNGENVTWRVSVYAFINNNLNQILVINASHNNLWQLPGGKVEMNESVDQAMERETLEETGYSIINSSPVPFYISEDYFFHEGTQTFHKTLQLYFTSELSDKNIDLSKMNDYDAKGLVSWMEVNELNKDNTQITFWNALQSKISK